MSGVPQLRGVLGSGYASTGNMRSSKYIKKLGASQLKSGDLIVMGAGSSGYGHVFIYYGKGSNGKIKVMDSYGGHGFQGVREVSFPPPRYAGSISITDVIMANGYTPVNPDGSVILPPEGGIISEDGNCVLSGGSTQAIASSCKVPTVAFIKAMNP